MTPTLVLQVPSHSLYHSLVVLRLPKHQKQLHFSQVKPRSCALRKLSWMTFPSSMPSFFLILFTSILFLFF
ncbi:hypothetical protein I7I53_09167 [Histoplasma capsulatum var. duboisii H88]|uniref:Uncharacterized protein n=1 Tax=Ajellomyces capsulatus (strain H88) TaxID=544711 RepID=A0A8A1L3J5_AJEC8|nr:hypothetical protein I7I53_09167 [Histoplasma capsulatum var. duboisii H88]